MSILKKNLKKKLSFSTVNAITAPNKATKKKSDPKQSDRILGILHNNKKGMLYLEPIERKQTKFFIDPASNLQAKAGDLVEVEIDLDRLDRRNYGKIRKIFCSMDHATSLSMIAIHAHDIPHEFSSPVLAEAEKASAVMLKSREDWRSIPFVTLDPEDAKDRDDAVFACPDPAPDNPGGHCILVAIADVAAYVLPGSYLDREACLRSNSVYFPDKVVPMLPEKISNELCSLSALEDRAALAVKMIFNKNGLLLSYKFHRILMQVRAQLSYEQAQNAIDGKADKKTAPIVELSLKPLWAAWQILKKARIDRQPLNLDIAEKKIIFDKDQKIKEIQTPPRLDAHRLIEDFMIAANVAAAKTLQEKKINSLYRIHEPPTLVKQTILRDVIKNYFPKKSNISKNFLKNEPSTQQFNQLLDEAQKTKQPELIHHLVLRSQNQAEYHTINQGHFGLNLPYYTHFTSPIRRYADLVIHRLLIQTLHLGEDGLSFPDKKQLQEIAQTISACERRSQLAERETTDRMIAHYLAEKSDVIFTGKIHGVTKAGLFIMLDIYGADGFIPIATLGREYFLFEEKHQALIGRNSGKGYQLGDDVRVRLAEITAMAGAIRFTMLTAPHNLPFKASRLKIIKK